MESQVSSCLKTTSDFILCPTNIPIVPCNIEEGVKINPFPERKHEFVVLLKLLILYFFPPVSFQCMSKSASFQQYG